MASAGAVVKRCAGNYGRSSSMMLDVIRDVQKELGSISDETIRLIARELNVSAVDVEGVVTFYHFFSRKPVGKYTVYLNNSAVACMKDRAAIAKAFEKETGTVFGSITSDGRIGLFDTSCIGMNDQEPSAIINDVIFTNLTESRVKDIVAGMKGKKDVKDISKEVGDGQNQSELIRSMVKNNLMKKGPVLFSPFEAGSALKKALSMTSEAVIDEMKKSKVRGRGGAGFTTGLKWEFTRKSQNAKKYVVCNADEGEPGTFKDRVILTEIPGMLFEGMAVAGYAIGADEGLLYLRAEYMYLKAYLDNVLADLRKKNILGNNALGKQGFNFDISIQMGAGAYICGEESALIESAEGKRGQPRNRPPFPPQYGYMGKPTTVNNVETFCCASRIMVEGGEWFARMGTSASTGTKLLSISGDCARPGIYEVEFGMTITEMLKEVGGENAVAVQVGGPSGTLIGKNDYGRKICYDDLATGGSMIAIGPQTDILGVVANFMDFFVEESCGYCVPCRAGNAILKHKLEKIIHGHGTATDLKELEEWCVTVKSMSRCGLGQTSPNPIQSSIKNFRHLYEEKLVKGKDYATEFNMAAAVKECCDVAKRKPNVHMEEH